MNKKLKLRLAQNQAEKFLSEHGLEKSIPINPKEIAEDILDMLVQAKPRDSKGVSGMLVKQGDSFGILYATHIDNEGFQRFSIAHEIGHFVMEGHIDYILPEGVEFHISDEQFSSKDLHEIEADYFAAALLMPKEVFIKESKSCAGTTLCVIKSLSEKFKTSLLSTAIRYVQLTNEECAIVISYGKNVDYCFMSNPLKVIKGIEWLGKGTLLPATSNVLQKIYKPTESDLSDWFGGRSVGVEEEVVSLGSYNKELTVLTLIEDIDEMVEEEELEESWKVGFN